MPVYRYKCDICGAVDEIIASIRDYGESYPCEVPEFEGYGEEDAPCPGTKVRSYAGTAPALGRVDGAGNSPSRASL